MKRYRRWAESVRAATAVGAGRLAERLRGEPISTDGADTDGQGVTPTVPMALELVHHPFHGDTLTFVLNAHRHDPFVNRLRRQFRASEVVRMVARLSEPGDAVVDVGANIGTVTLPLAKMGRRVLAVEALAENYMLLVEAIHANRLTQVTPVHVAASDEAGLATFGGSSAYGQLEPDGSGTEIVPLVRMDVLLEVCGFEDCSVLKLDVEGSELAALQGLTTMLAAGRPPHLLLEGNGAHSERMGYRPGTLLEFLEGYGYANYLIHRGKLIPRKGSDFQEFGNADYVATRALPDTLAGLVVGEVGTSERLQAMMTALGNPNPLYRRFMVNEIALAPTELLDEPDIRRIISDLRKDPEERVRAGAARALARLGGG